MAALYRAPAVFCPARADVQLGADALHVTFPDGKTRRMSLHDTAASTDDGCVVQKVGLAPRAPRPGEPNPEPPRLRRFVRMLVVERGRETLTVITPPEQGAVAPSVVHVAEAPTDAAIVSRTVWESLSDWLLSGGRLAACAIGDLARLAQIATASFAAVIGEVCAQRALELVGGGPLRGGLDVESALHPLSSAARTSARANEALLSARAHAAGETRRRRRW